MTTPSPSRSERWHVPTLLLFWLAVFASSLATPPLLDDADATHAQAAQAMLHTGDWVTLHVDGIRYLEKAPLPYWIAALSLRLFGQNAFAIHLPLALAVLGLALLGYIWSKRSFSQLTAFYSGLFVLTSTGVFLFTRIFIPEVLLSLLLATGLYAFHLALEKSEAYRESCHPERSEGLACSPGRSLSQYLTATSNLPRSSTVPALCFWLFMALAVLTKGLIAIVFLLGTAGIYLTLTRTWRHWRALRPITGSLLFFVIAAPWHILASLRNTNGSNGHGFFWFYFVNEHFLRFLGRRTPRDYNKLPAALYWLLHLVWLFPWSFFLPAAAHDLWQKFRAQTPSMNRNSNLLPPLPIQLGFMLLTLLCILCGAGITTTALIDLIAFSGLLVVSHRLADGLPWTPFVGLTEPCQTQLLLFIFSALVLVFFSLSTNQEYYTFPVYLPLLMLLAATIATQTNKPQSSSLRASFTALAIVATLIAMALAYGLWTSRHLAFVPDIGTVVSRRGIGNYTLSLSHFFDLTGASFAALRLPAALAAAAFPIGSWTALFLARRHRLHHAVLAIAITSATFLIAAHIALNRFSAMLSSQAFAAKIQSLETSRQINPNPQILMLGDQSYGSSIPFYLQHTVQLVDGRSSSMLFGGTFQDVPPIFITSAQLASTWGSGPRKLLFVPEEQRDTADRILGSRQIVIMQSSGKALITDRPLDPSSNFVSSTKAPVTLVISTEAKRSGETPVFAPAHTDGSPEAR